MITHLHQPDESGPGFPIAESCATLGVSRGGYYDHLRKPERPRRREDGELAGLVEGEFIASRRNYGSRMILRSLRQKGRRHGRRRLARLMALRHLRAKRKGRARPGTTDSGHGHAPAPNLLRDAAPPTRPNQVWVTDITYLASTEGWQYLSATMDLCTRKIVAWEIRDTLHTELCSTTLERALERERPDTHALAHHSDRGVQYASMEFRTLLSLSQIAQSMSRRGNCYDNAAMESFWATLKCQAEVERSPGEALPTPCELARLTFDYIETFYNRTRLHSSLNYMSPLDFEKSLNDLHPAPVN